MTIACTEYVLAVGQGRLENEGLKDDRLGNGRMENCEAVLAHGERSPFFAARFCPLRVRCGRETAVVGLRSNFLTFHFQPVFIPR